MPFTVLDPALAEPAPILAVGAPLVDRGETLASMEQELYSQLGGRDDADPARLRRFINWGYVDLAVSLKIDELQSSYGLVTVADQPLYIAPPQIFAILPDGFALVNSSHPNGGWPLEKTDRSSYRRAEARTDVPEYFFRQGNLFVLWPTPNTEWPISVDFWIRPDFMTADNHSPLLGIEWHEVIVLCAKEKAFDAFLEPTLAMNARNQWLSIVRRRRDSAADEQDGKLAGLFPVTDTRQLSGRGRVFDQDIS